MPSHSDLPHLKVLFCDEGLTRISQKLRRVVLPVGVVDSGVLVPVLGVGGLERLLRIRGEGLLRRL